MTCRGNFSLCHFPAVALFTSLALNAAKFSIPFYGVIRQPQVRRSLEVEMLLANDVRFLLPLIEVIKIFWITYVPLDISGLPSTKPRLRHGRRHTRHSLLYLVVNQSILSILSLAVLSHLSQNLSNSSFPRELASVYTDYLRFHFFIPSQRPCVAQSETTCPSLDDPRALSIPC